MPTPGRRSVDPFRAAERIGGKDTICWFDANDRERIAVADKGATKLELHKARLARQSAKWGERNFYEGRYWFAQLGKHVFHDSMTEFGALMVLDHEVALKAIAAQPMCILFKDGLRHYPDYFAVRRDGTQVVYDVKPQGKRWSDKTVAKFSATRELCARIGWDYEILLGPEGVEYRNLELLSMYRFPWITADPGTEQQILDSIDGPTPFRDVHNALHPTSPGANVHVLYNLMWNRRIFFNRQTPLNDNTLLSKEPSNV